MKPVIVFDLGGVLLDWDPRHLYRKIFADLNEMENFLRNVCSPIWNRQMDSGKSFQEAVAELAEEYPEYTTEIEAYDSRWVEMVSGEIPGSVEILKDLKAAGYPLAALSNWSAETFPRIRSLYAFLDWFDPLVISGEVGVSKPASEIYTILLEKLQRKAEDCLFIDDMQENLDAAIKLGFQGIQFASSEQLRSELMRRSIL